ncbi:MAG: metallophosphoesterase [Pseudomonadota bacterium]
MNLQQLLTQRELPTSGQDVEHFNGGVDFIGDVHGCFDSLEALLKALGYVHDGDCFRYAGEDGPRKVIFVGDLVDRGPRIRDVMHCVHAMVEHGEAQLVMGNHEFHALSYYIPARDDPTEFIRPHTTKNFELLKDTIAAFEGLDDEWAYLRGWLLERPIFIEHPKYRVVHACWDHNMIDQYRERFQCNTVDRDFVLDFADRSSFAYAFLERCMRGIELCLPDGVFIRGTDGTLRDNFRARFWLENPKTYDDVIFRKYMLPDDMVGPPIMPNKQGAFMRSIKAQ